VQPTISERHYWVGFSLIDGFGPVRFRQLESYFGSLQEAWTAAPAALEAAGIDRRALGKFREIRPSLDLTAEMARLDKLGISILTWNDDEYPGPLKELRKLDQAPPVLYLRGTLFERDDLAVAIVGTRNASAYGRQVAHQLAGELAANGLTIVSGLAHGIDTQAHRAALETGGRTIAVLPCGLDTIYPAENRHLVADILRSGLILSPFPLKTAPIGRFFPYRNSVISGLSLGVIVIEAAEKSGSTLTAGIAMEQGREVFAVPGNITAKGSSGTNSLIRDGAHPVLSAQDVLDVLDIQRVSHYKQARTELPPVSGPEQALLDALGTEPVHIDELARQLDMPVSQMSGTLTLLQLKGLVREVGPMTYCRS